MGAVGNLEDEEGGGETTCQDSLLAFQPFS